MSDEFDDEVQIDVLRYSPTVATRAAERQRSRVARLARFVEQVSPEALQ